VDYVEGKTNTLVENVAEIREMARLAQEDIKKLQDFWLHF